MEEGKPSEVGIREQLHNLNVGLTMRSIKSYIFFPGMRDIKKCQNNLKLGYEKPQVNKILKAAMTGDDLFLSMWAAASDISEMVFSLNMKEIRKVLSPTQNIFSTMDSACKIQTKTCCGFTISRIFELPLSGIAPYHKTGNFSNS